MRDINIYRIPEFLKPNYHRRSEDYGPIVTHIKVVSRHLLAEPRQCTGRYAPVVSAKAMPL
jgi:hypothetical protein